MALYYFSRVFFESSAWSIQASRPVYPQLWMWHWAIDELFTLPSAISQILPRQISTLPNLISQGNNDSTCSIYLMKHVVLAFKYPQGLIWTKIVTIQKWFTVINLWIENCQYHSVHLSREGHAISQLWFHLFEIRLQYIISTITFTTIMMYWRNLESNTTQRKSWIWSLTPFLTSRQHRTL